MIFRRKEKEKDEEIVSARCTVCNKVWIGNKDEVFESASNHSKEYSHSVLVDEKLKKYLMDEYEIGF